MTRRRTLLSALGSTPLLGMLPRPAAAAALPLRISTPSTDTDLLTKALQDFKAGVEKALPGEIAVSVHPGSSLFRQNTELPALQRGNLEMSTMTTFEVDQQIPELGPYSAGYVVRDYDHLRKVFGGPLGQEYFSKVAAQMGVQIIDVVYLGTRQMNLRTVREVRTPADLRSVKLRMPPGPGWTALGRGLGVVPTPMPNPEVYLALKSGAIDGQENPPGLTRANNFHEVTQQVVLTSHLVQPVFFAFGKPFWDKLTPAQQTVLREQARIVAEAHDRARVADETATLEFFRSNGLRVTPVELEPFRAAVAKQYVDGGLTARWAPGLVDRIQAAA
ncbi:TRAP transporter substrate-binding protein DctP [Roseomonas sp. BN140053]|uniref:TRAP transporter substrate-binding protein DctP n=1 Tax=Roseomonas sp. BN140053 TaxID=3391898 RepID=UPI0039E75FBB